jgi:hypothetical protein
MESHRGPALHACTAARYTLFLLVAIVKAEVLDRLLEEFAPSYGAGGAAEYLVGKPAYEVDKFYVAWNAGQLDGIIRRSQGETGTYVAYLGGIDDRLRCLFALSLKRVEDFVIRLVGRSWRFHSWGVTAKIARDAAVIEPKPVIVTGREPDFKIVTYVPQDDLAKVRESLFAVGAGRYSLYSRCSFSSHGQGTFLGEKGSKPAYGQPGRMEEMEEERLEVLVPSERIGRAIAALKRVHPYEEPVIETYELDSRREFGEGRIGSLPAPAGTRDAARKIASVLGSQPVYVSGDSKCMEIMIWDGRPEQGIYEALMRDIDLYVGPDSKGLSRLSGRVVHADVVEFPRYCFLMAGAKELVYMVREKSKREAWGLRTFLPSKVGKEGVHA